MQPIGRTIRLLRHQKGWNQQEVAARLGLSVPAYSKIETGITDINLSRIEDIAALFGITVVHLLSAGRNPADDGAGELSALTDRLQEKDDEVMELRRKVISLFDELKNAL